MLLEVKDLNVYYGAIHALQGITFGVGDGEIVSLIGANGAGKSTTLNSLSGLLQSRSGSVHFRDADFEPGNAGGDRRTGGSSRYRRGARSSVR